MELDVDADGTFTGRAVTPMRGTLDEEVVTGTWGGSAGVFTFDVEDEEPLVVTVRDGALFFVIDEFDGGWEMKLVRE
jgi:hypothetical protein